MLARPAVVEFVVFRIAPDCKRIGTFRVAGRSGINRIRFRGRIRGRLLTPGTYDIRARAVGGARTLTRTRLVIFDRLPRPEEVRAARVSNVCGAGARSDSAGAGESSGLPSGAGAKSGTGEPAVLRVQGADSGRARAKPPLSVGVLGERFTRVTEAVKEIHPVLYLLLGIAIALLAIAAIPTWYVTHDRIAALLAYRRAAVALAGAGALVAVTLLYALV